jgi:hypothetical protein
VAGDQPRRSTSHGGSLHLYQLSRAARLVQTRFLKPLDEPAQSPHSIQTRHRDTDSLRTLERACVGSRWGRVAVKAHSAEVIECVILHQGQAAECVLVLCVAGSWGCQGASPLLLPTGALPLNSAGRSRCGPTPAAQPHPAIPGQTLPRGDPRRYAAAMAPPAMAAAQIGRPFRRNGRNGRPFQPPRWRSPLPEAPPPASW